MPFRARPAPAHPRDRFRGRVARVGRAPSLSKEWKAWLAENLLLRAPRQEILATLVANGVPEPLAAQEIDSTRRSPLMHGANQVARLLRRHEVVARMKRTLASLGADPGGVERRSGVSPEEFFERYYAGNLPVILTDGMAPWPAARQWSPAQWKERIGHIEVEAMVGRESAPFFEPFYKKYSTTMRLGEFCDRITSSGETNDIYLVANNRLSFRPGIEPLLADVAAPHDYLDARRTGHVISLWLGPAGTVTTLHHDTGNVIFCQVYGRKRLRLFPPHELFLTHHIHHGVHSWIDADHPDLETFPEFASLTRKEVVLEPGETLFIPLGWWHHVRALDVSISVSFTNFLKPNHFEWYYPGRIE